MFFGFQLTCGLMLVFYGYSVMKNPRVWGDQGRQAVKAENFPEYCRQNGLFFLKAGFLMALIGALDALFTLSALLYLLLYVFGLAFAFYPLTRWCKANEGFSWPWPRVESEKRHSSRSAFFVMLVCSAPCPEMLIKTPQVKSYRGRVSGSRYSCFS